MRNALTNQTSGGHRNPTCSADLSARPPTVTFLERLPPIVVCLGVAVMKYRLYELDRIISRVVSYTLITALLGGAFQPTQVAMWLAPRP